MAALIAVGGLSGSGKSTLARRLADACEASLIRSDVERKRLFGVSETTRLGPDGYTADVTARVYAALGAQAETALRAGRSIIVDAVFQRPEERDEVAAVARRCEAHFVGLWLEAPLKTRRDRVARRVGDASDATTGVVEAQASRDCGFITWHSLDAALGADIVFGCAAARAAGKT
jgi:uncharacterized protein